MNQQRVWLITGAGRGIGTEIAKAALAAGHSVVATGRDPLAVAKAVGKSENLLVLTLDITKRDQAEAVANTVIEKFGHIDVLVNNAANFFAGFFEELSMEQIEQQISTGLLGQMLVTRAILPQMRKQRSGHIINISSTAGITAGEFCTAYAAAKFGMEGWTEALQAEILPFGIHTTLINPGFFRSELLSEQSTTFVKSSIADYADRTSQYVSGWKSMNGKQPGDTAKLARAIIKI
ncbi:MAG: SDR family oxidoreductase, partial [Proteobacteria bacterium]